MLRSVKQTNFVSYLKLSKGEITDPKTGRPYQWDSTDLNIQMNCEYEFELFMELKGQFTKVTLINAYLVKITYLSIS